MINVRAASTSDKGAILSFCQGTFTWGDYIAEVWDSWMDQGDLLVATYDGIPVGVSHISYPSKYEAWFEGLRVHPDYRRHGVARALSAYGFELTRAKGAKVGRALIAGENIASQTLSSQAGFNKVVTLHFWSVETPTSPPTPLNRIFRKAEPLDLQRIMSYLESHDLIQHSFVWHHWKYLSYFGGYFQKFTHV